MLSVRRLVFAGALLAVVPLAAVGQDTKSAPKAEPKAMPSATTGPGGAVVTPSPYGPGGAAVMPGPAYGPGGPAVMPGPGNPCPPAPCPPAPCPPTTRKVCKMVPTQCQETRTVMKQVQRQECYTAYRTETVQEKKCVPVTTYKHVTETVMETRTHCVKVPCWEENTCMEKRKKIEWVTEYKEKCHVSFQKECKTVSFGGHDCCFGGHGGGCCDKGCDTGCGGGCDTGCCNKGFSFSFPVCKPCITKECVPCCVPKCTYECVPVCKKVCTYRTETKTECVPVCKTRCVPCTENKEVVCCKQVCVPYQATRCVTECVPTTETVTVCKMVPTWVEEACPAPAAPCAPANACPQTNACDTGCGNNNAGCCDNGGGKGCCLFDKFSGCCDKLGGCLSAAKCNICDNVGGCCDKVGCCVGDLCGAVGGCCSKLKCCIPSCHINLCNPCCK